MNRPRGTRDFLPEEMATRRRIEVQLRHIAERFGFGEVSTPTFEEEQLFVLRSGDAILEELYAFEDKGGRRIALRPEITAPVMRVYVNKLQFDPKPIKLYYLSNAFRYERPQSGRYREFWQFGAEVIGADTALATAETIAMAAEMVKACGVNERILRVGHIGVLKAILEDGGIPPEQQYPFLHKMDKGELEELRNELTSRANADLAETVISIAEDPSNIEGAMAKVENIPKAKECLEVLSQVRDILGWMGVEDMQPDLAVVRGLDYYTGIVFEIDAPRLGAEKQVCGGGEYRLAHIFGGKDVATVGYGLGFDRILLAASAEGLENEALSLDYFIIPVSEEVLETCLALAKNLRTEGHAVEVDLVGRNVKKNMKYASSRNAKTVIIIGPRDLEKGACTFHDMNSGEDVEHSLNDLIGK